jgi:DHA1 family bicyclomycin/chloramphenicol resistance-like MFS transporter
MNPEASRLWRGPRWTLAILLAGLATVGPFSIDTYLPAFTGIAADLGAAPIEMQQTLSGYLFGFAVMNLFHGAISDSVGRRPVILAGMALFAAASAGCALAGSVGQLILWRTVQGMSAGAGVVCSRAIIRDMFPVHEAQKMMSQVTLFFGVAPAVAPMVGGLLFVHAGWRAVFFFLVAVGMILLVSQWRLLPETLHRTARQSFHPLTLLREYARLSTNRNFLALAITAGIPFNGVFIYILSAPVFLGEHLGLAPTQFFWCFCCVVSGIMGGAWWSGRLAGKIRPRQQVRRGFIIMGVVTVLNLALNFTIAPNAFWALPLLAVFALGWSLITPVATILALDQLPERRGMASSLQTCISSLANAAIAGGLAPLVMHSPRALALSSAIMMGIGLFSWAWVKRRVC